MLYQESRGEMHGAYDASGVKMKWTCPLLLADVMVTRDGGTHREPNHSIIPILLALPEDRLFLITHPLFIHP